MQNQDKLQQKQNFLRQQILYKGYDPLNFKEYLDTLKQNGGSNLDIWQFDQIKQVYFYNKVVKKYKLNQIQMRRQSQLNQFLRNNQPMTQQQILKMQQFSIESNFQKQTNMNNQQLHLKNKLNGINIQINRYYYFISYQKIQQTGIFNSSYIVYIVQVKQLQWKVSRRYSDFQWLRQTLAKQFPLLILPVIPMKGLIRNFQTSHLQKRMKQLQLFLQILVKNEQVLISHYLESFLKIGDEYIFKQIKNNGKGLKEKCISKLIFLDKNNDNKCNEQMDFFMKNTFNYSKEVKFLHNQIYLVFQQIQKLSLEINNCFNKLSEFHQKLIQKLKYYNQKILKNQKKQMQNVLQNIKIFHINISTKFNRCAKNYAHNLLSLEYFYTGIYDQMCQKIQTREKIKEKYETYLKKNNQNKNLYKEMLIYSSQYIKQTILKYNQLFVQLFSKNYIKYCIQQSNIIGDEHIYLADMISELQKYLKDDHFSVKQLLLNNFNKTKLKFI